MYYLTDLKHFVSISSLIFNPNDPLLNGFQMFLTLHFHISLDPIGSNLFCVLNPATETLVKYSLNFLLFGKTTPPPPPRRLARTGSPDGPQQAATASDTTVNLGYRIGGPPLANGEKSAPSPPCIAVAVNIDVQYVYLLYSLRELIEPLPQADN